MTIKQSDWNHKLQHLSKEVNGELSIVKNYQMGYEYSLYTSYIHIPYKMSNIIISQNASFDFKYSKFSKFKFAYSFETIKRLNFNIYQKTFFEKLFSKNELKIDNTFFKKYSFYTNDKPFARYILKAELITFILENPNTLFTIESKKKNLEINLKNFNDDKLNDALILYKKLIIHTYSYIEGLPSSDREP